ncbi:SMI1/KNR4 family protein [Chamaesiphon polymorphus]|uniref:Knr4/Smi1-like domain-containing protein n=1 Tax=Chamaesiphon polymorphus CCALA 037 TaxID=2107692 RepID=A0A2T1GN30_9CYAN|nr:SMI1/KNR4 family protein [Chamaesiphon polymorphus]PSB59332.1 hypothetical protein C7B77_01435 [Chamaesiphon polymorphus CCALA 037]
MNKLIELGFEKYREINEEIKELFFQSTGYKISNCFWDFIEHRQSQNIVFGYSFINSQSHEEWEGQIESWIFDEFDNLEEICSSTINLLSRVFLPIANDAGGNYIYIEISKPNQPVVDVSYSTGVISEISSSFEEFLDKIYPYDE